MEIMLLEKAVKKPDRRTSDSGPRLRILVSTLAGGALNIGIEPRFSAWALRMKAAYSGVTPSAWQLIRSPLSSLLASLSWLRKKTVRPAMSFRFRY